MHSWRYTSCGQLPELYETSYDKWMKTGGNVGKSSNKSAKMTGNGKFIPPINMAMTVG